MAWAVHRGVWMVRDRGAAITFVADAAWYSDACRMRSDSEGMKH
jgi:hypothetical protein